MFLKTAQTVFKKGDKSKEDNYRSISVLPLLKKVFKKLLYARLIILTAIIFSIKGSMVLGSNQIQRN